VAIDCVLTLSAIVDSSSDAIVTLDYALVMEAPSYTLEGLRAEKLCDTETVRAITTEVANCLLFWHCDARMVHGNIVRYQLLQYQTVVLLRSVHINDRAFASDAAKYRAVRGSGTLPFQSSQLPRALRTAIYWFSCHCAEFVPA
jgi:hypothetical protein